MKQTYSNYYAKDREDNSRGKSWDKSRDAIYAMDRKKEMLDYAFWRAEKEMEAARAERRRLEAKKTQRQRDLLISDCICHAFSDPAGTDCPERQNRK